MTSSIKTNNGKLNTEIMKRTASYLKGATREYVKDVMPVSFDILKEAKNSTSKISSTFASPTHKTINSPSKISTKK